MIIHKSIKMNKKACYQSGKQGDFTPAPYGTVREPADSYGLPDDVGN